MEVLTKVPIFLVFELCLDVIGVATITALILDDVKNVPIKGLSGRLTLEYLGDG